MVRKARIAWDDEEGTGLPGRYDQFEELDDPFLDPLPAEQPPHELDPFAQKKSNERNNPSHESRNVDRLLSEQPTDCMKPGRRDGELWPENDPRREQTLEERKGNPHEDTGAP